MPKSVHTLTQKPSQVGPKTILVYLEASILIITLYSVFVCDGKD